MLQQIIPLSLKNVKSSPWLAKVPSSETFRIPPDTTQIFLSNGLPNLTRGIVRPDVLNDQRNQKRGLCQQRAQFHFEGISKIVPDQSPEMRIVGRAASQGRAVFGYELLKGREDEMSVPAGIHLHIFQQA